MKIKTLKTSDSNKLNFGLNKEPDKKPTPSGIIYIPTAIGTKIPITYGGESVEDLSADEIFKRVVDNTGPMLKSTWEGLKAASINWFQNVAGPDAADAVVKSLTGRIGEIAKDRVIQDDKGNFVYEDSGKIIGNEANEFMVESFKEIDKAQKKIQYAGSLIKGGGLSTEGPSAKEFFGGALSTVQSLVTTMLPALLTRGATIAPQMAGSMYGDYNLIKAKELYGDDPKALDKLVKNNEVEFSTPIALAYAAAAGEYVGIKGVGKAIAKSGLRGKNFIQHLRAAGGEGTTEWYQTGVEGYNQALAEGKTAAEAAEAAWESMSSAEGLEAFVQGAFGSGIITTTSSSLKKAYISARDNSEGIGIVPKSMRDLASLKEKALETTDPDVREGIENQIIDLTEKIKNSVAKGNEIVESANKQEISILADSQTALELYKTKASSLVAKLNAGTITQEEHDLALAGYVNEYKKSQEAAKNVISNISTKNQKISDTNKELIDIIKNPESKENEINLAKNKLVANNQGLINNIINKNFDPTKDTGLTREDFEAEANLIFSNLINTYKIDSGVPFGAYAKQNLQRRIPSIFEKFVETRITEEGEREIISKQDITETQIEDIVEQAEIDKPTITKLKTSLKLDDATINKVTDAVKKVFGTSLPAVTDKKFKKSFTDSIKNELTDLVKSEEIFGKDSIEFENFLKENAESIYNSLPLEVMTKSFAPFVEKQFDPATGKPLREATKEGKEIFNKKDFSEVKDDFINYFISKDLGSSTRSDRKTSIAKQIADQLARDEVVNILVKDPNVLEKFKQIQELEGKEVPSDLEGAILRIIDRIDSYLLERSKNNSLKVEIIPGITVLQNLFDAFIKQVKIGLEKGLPFAKAVDNALNFAAKYFYDAKSFEEFKTAVKKLNEKDFVDAKNLKELRKIWGNITVKDLQKYGVETSSVNYLNLQLKNAKTLKNQQAVLKAFLLSEARSIKNVTSGYLNTNQKLINFIKKNIKNADPKLISTLKVKEGNIFIGKEKISSAGTKEVFKNSIKQGNFDESIQISNTAKKYFENLMQYYIDTGNIKDGVAHLKLLSIDQRGLLRQLAKPNLHVSLDKDLKNTTLEHDPPVSQFFEAAITSIQDPSKYNKFKTNVLANYNINLIPNEIDNILKEEGLNESLPDGVDIYENPNARMQIPRVLEAIKKDKGILDLKNELPKDKDLSKDINQILEETKNIPADEIVSEVRAKVNGKKAEKIRLFVPYTAEDFLGLLYQFAGKGKKGDRHLAWIKENLTDPLSKGLMRFEASQQASNKALKAVKKIIKDLNIDLGAEAIDGFTNDQAIRVFLWSKNGYDIKGISAAEIDKINKYVRTNLNELQFSDELENVYPEGVYPEPTPEWLAGTLTTDLLNHINTETRSESLQEFFDNVNDIFGNFDKNKGKLTGENTNKIRSIYGDTFIKALESALYRISTGRNRSYQLDHQGNLALNWLNDSVGTIMFFNTRSAILQTISAINFTNWTDNNPLMQAKAFANQKQFWKDFAFLFNSDYLKERRSGLRTDINADEIASSAEKSTNKIRAAISTILKKGFLPTQIADSFAISIGGASFYRNRLDNYIKQGLEKAEAEERAFQDFREISETSQQSSRPDKISMEQASFLGRLVLAFQNTPMQYNRLMKKAILDLTNNRGDWKTNLSKIMYYGAIQNALFYSLQQGLFALLFDDEDEEKEKDRYFNLANGMADSILRGAGIFGAIVSTLKNASFKTIEELKDKRPDYTNVIQELSGISPPLNSKFRKLRSAGRKFTYRQEKEKMRELGLDTKNPAILAGAEILSAGLNIPADRALYKINNLRDASDSENEYWQRIALALGWNKWSLGMTDNNQTQPKTSGLKTKKLKTKSLKTKKLKN